MKSLMRVSRKDHNPPGEISDVSDIVDSTESYNQSLLNLPHTKNKQVINIIERLVGIVETGRGGMRTLQGEQFNDTMTKLAAFYIDLQSEELFPDGKKLCSILRASGGHLKI